MTDGSISSMAGLNDDPRHFQISVPVQPGNSGGPLFDESGNVIGLVVSALDAVKLVRHSGTIPQNVNYAIRINYAIPMLSPFSDKLLEKRQDLDLEAAIQKAQKSVVLVLVK